jgi:hypothetical protein
MILCAAVMLMLLLVVAQKLPVTDVCDGDVMNACLQERALDEYGIGKIRTCLKELGLPTPAPVVEGLETEQVWPLV